MDEIITYLGFIKYSCKLVYFVRFYKFVFSIIIVAVLQVLSDSELIVLIKRGDKAAYTEIYNRYFPLLYIHAYRRLRNEEDAKDLLQELFTLVWHKRADLSLSNLSGYLYTALRNRILDMYSHVQVSNKYIASLENYITTAHSTTDHLVREKELSLWIEEEIKALPPRMREVFELSRKSNLTHKEIASQLNLSEQTVSKHVTNALKTLRVKLGVFVFILMIISS